MGLTLKRTAALQISLGAERELFNGQLAFSDSRTFSLLDGTAASQADSVYSVASSLAAGEVNAYFMANGL